MGRERFTFKVCVASCTKKMPAPDQPVVSRLAYLDGIRGLSCIFVLVRHIVQEKNGWCADSVWTSLGGDLSLSGFYVLSAYLLTLTLMKHLDKCQTFEAYVRQMVVYSIKRVLRVYPMYVAICVLVQYLPIHEVTVLVTIMLRYGKW